MTNKPRNELLPGTLDMLILKTLTLGPMHGYGIAQHIQQVSDALLQVEEGSLYPALQRMRLRGWLTATWKRTPNNRRARFYTVTAAGRKQLGDEISSFDSVMLGIAKVMQTS
jgi:PadR family transcriptional regulator, regulatory protein PadR